MGSAAGWRYRFRARVSDNERDQLIERVDDLQAHQDESCDHQIKAEMHEELATKCLLPRARIALAREPSPVRIGKDRLGELFAGDCNRKPPPPRK